MKSNLWLLLKTNIINSFKLRSTSNKKKILITIFALYIIATLVVTLSTFLFQLFNILNTSGLTTYYLPVLFALASFFAFLFTIYSAKSGLFENKDNDLLLSLPLKRTTVLLSRLLYLAIYNLIIGLVFLGPGIYIYITGVGTITFTFVIAIIFMIIFFPIIPTILASLFGYLIATLTAKTGKKSVFELIYYTLFIFVYMLIITNSNKLLVKLTSNVALLNRLLKIFFLPIEVLNKAITTNNLFYVLGFIAINILCLLLFAFILNKSYFKIISNLNTQKTKSNFKMKTLTLKSQRRALKEKELKRYFSSAIYVFNTAFGVVFLILAAGASLFYSQDKILALTSQYEAARLDSFSLVLMLILFVCTMTDTTNSSISIERNNFWILKSLPLKTKDIFSAKLFVNRIILLPVAIISLLLFNVTGYIDFTQMILLMIFTFFYNGFVSNFGLIANLLFPNFSAINDTAIVKQSAASLVGIMVPFVIVIIGMPFLLSDTVNKINSLCILIGLAVFLYFITMIIINTWGTKKFDKIG